MDLKNTTRVAILQLYETRGIAAVDDKLKKLIVECEHSGYTVRQRSDIKGELAEVAVECHIREAQKRIPNLAYVKGLCFALQNRTTEIDLLMCTPYKAYLYECKSFSGKKTLTDKCFLKGKSSEKDVYGQSLYHLDMLHKHLFPYLREKAPKQPPFMLMLFEFSSDDVEDLRTDYWKKKIPLLTLGNIDAWLDKELTKRLPVAWDFLGVLDKLNELNSVSDKTFDLHLKRMMHR